MVTSHKSAYSLSFEWIYFAGCIWLVVGAYIDGWAHNHLRIIETFFTPWHAILYSGYAATAITLLLRIMQSRSVPIGHGLSILGVLLFFVGGLGDMVWHIFFGIEFDVEALLSPTHLLIASGAFLISTGGFRSGIAHRKRVTIPAVGSLILGASIITYMTQFAYYTLPL